MESTSDGEIAEAVDSVFAGTQTGANKIFVVTPVNADKISSSDRGDTVKVVPSGGSYEYEIETDLLRPWLNGKDIRRWRCDWSGQHVILPYYVEINENGVREANTYTEDEMKAEFPKTWEYLSEHREKLESRESGKMRGRDDWFAFTYPKSHHRFELPKVVAPAISMDSRFMLDEDGSWYYKTGYGIQFIDELIEDTDSLTAQLNSNALNFYFKHIASLKISGAYEYRAQYIEKLPFHIPNNQSIFNEIGEKVNIIVEITDLNSKTDRFPEAYIGAYNGEIDYINYTWQTRRYPVNAKIDEDDGGEFTVGAGRSDTIKKSEMYSGDREARKKRAEYVHAAVDGRNVKSGEETTIPIPRTDDGVEALLAELEADKETVEETSIDELEAEIDEAVYDLFDLTEDEREVIEEYLEVF